MSSTPRISMTLHSLQQAILLRFSSDRMGFYPHVSTPAFRVTSLSTNRRVCLGKMHVVGGHLKASTGPSGEGPVLGLDPSPVSIELEPISTESQFDRIITEAQQLEEPVVILWMASWCRKCIYLKPKLEKLAADYNPRIRFYSINVNDVSHKLVARAGVTKMPTIQLWRDGKKQAEVIGGHKAHLVVNEVRGMIEDEFTM